MAVALLAPLGAFLSGAGAAMTDVRSRASPSTGKSRRKSGTDPLQLLRNVKSFPSVTTALPGGVRERGRVHGDLEGARRRAAGPGFVLGIPANYRSTYPGELTQLIGATQGALIAQQLAANLAVGLGDQITIERAGLPSARGCVSPV